MRILGPGADGDSKIRKYFHIRCHSTVNRRVGINATDFTFFASSEKLDDDNRLPELMFPNQLDMIKKVEKSVAKHKTSVSYGVGGGGGGVGGMCYVRAPNADIQ